MSVADRQCADPEAPGLENDDRAPFEIVLDRGEVREQQRCLLLGAPLRPATVSISLSAREERPEQESFAHDIDETSHRLSARARSE